MNFRARLSLTNLEHRYTPTDPGVIDPFAGTYTPGTYSSPNPTDPTAPPAPMQPVAPAPASPGTIPTYDPMSPYTP